MVYRRMDEEVIVDMGEGAMLSNLNGYQVGRERVVYDHSRLSEQVKGRAVETSRRPPACVSAVMTGVGAGAGRPSVGETEGPPLPPG